MKQLYELFDEQLQLSNLDINETEMTLEESVDNFNGAMNTYFSKVPDKSTFGRVYNGDKVVVKNIQATSITSIKKLGSLIKPVFDDIGKFVYGKRENRCVAWLEVNGVDCVGVVGGINTIDIYPSKNSSSIQPMRELKVSAAAQATLTIIADVMGFKTDKEVKEFFKNPVKVQYKIVYHEREKNAKKHEDRRIINKDRSENIKYALKLKALTNIVINKFKKQKYDNSSIMLIEQFVRENIDKASKGLFKIEEYVKEVDRSYSFKTTINGEESDNSLDNIQIVHALLYLCYIVNYLKNEKWEERFDNMQKAIISNKKLYDFHNASRLAQVLDDL